ncbi:MAG: hypothetical protein U0Q22_08380 [Acidimicrobiales bacterium]
MGNGARRHARRTIGTMLAVVATLGWFTTACAPDVGPLTPQQQVDQIIAFVESVRGHSFVTRPDVEFVPDSIFQQHVLASIVTAEPSLDVDEVAFKALGWMPPGDDLFAKYQIAFSGTVVGFYDPATKVLEVRGSELTPYRREVVAHELTHALDDQLHDLNISKGDGVLSEAQLAFLVGVEGDAVRTQQAYVATMSPLDQIADVAEQLSFQIDPQILSVPLALLSISQTPYLRGPQFIAGLGGNSGIDAMFSRYPSTAEQAWSPAKYLADEGAVPVPTPPAAGTVVNSGSWGRFFMTLVLGNGVNLDGSVDPVTDGWAGDAYVTWTSGAQRCIRIDTRSDTAAQSATLGAALTTWSQGHSGATVAAVDATTVRLTSCV